MPASSQRQMRVANVRSGVKLAHGAAEADAAAFDDVMPVGDLGQVLDPVAEAGGLTVINRPDFGTVAYGQRAVDRDLLPMLLQLKAGFAPAFKISLMSFQLDQRDVLTAQTDRGWTIIFGQMVTSDDRATLTPKLAALRALGSRVDFTSTQIQYINLENPGAPAVQMRARR